MRNVCSTSVLISANKLMSISQDSHSSSNLLQRAYASLAFNYLQIRKEVMTALSNVNFLFKCCFIFSKGHCSVMLVYLYMGM